MGQRKDSRLGTEIKRREKIRRGSEKSIEDEEKESGGGGTK